jgi:hypothetical protein
MSIKLSISSAGQALLSWNIPGTHFYFRLSKRRAVLRLEGLGKLRNTSELIGIRKGYLPENK